MSSTNRNTPRSLLSSLPPEIVSIIADYCAVSELRALLLTCRTLYLHVVLVLKYRNIQLNVLRLDLEPLPERQHACIEKLLDHPYLGTHVRELSWRVLARFGRVDGLTPEEQKLAELDRRVWDVFRTFRNVTRLDLSCSIENWACDHPRRVPHLSFPAVTDLTLSGIMYRQMFEALVKGIDASKLLHLKLDHLEGPGHRDGQPPFSYDRAVDFDARGYYVDDPNREPAGWIDGVLPLIQNDCSSLRTVSFTRGVQISGFPGALIKVRNSKVTRYYKEIGSFLRATNLTLERVYFEEEVPTNVAHALLAPDNSLSIEEINIRDGYSLAMQNMDIRFQNNILPVLKTITWPQLKEMSIVGLEPRTAQRTQEYWDYYQRRTQLSREVKFTIETVPDIARSLVEHGARPPR